MSKGIFALWLLGVVLGIAGLVCSLFSLSGCGGEADAPPLACTDSVDGERLVVTCNRAVLAVPDACELGSTVDPNAVAYRCNWLHASAEQCAAFPGICQ
jgi:hypothetical protein